MGILNHIQAFCNNLKTQIEWGVEYTRGTQFKVEDRFYSDGIQTPTYDGVRFSLGIRARKPFFSSYFERPPYYFFGLQTAASALNTPFTKPYFDFDSEGAKDFTARTRTALLSLSPRLGLGIPIFNRLSLEGTGGVSLNHILGDSIAYHRPPRGIVEYDLKTQEHYFLSARLELSALFALKPNTQIGFLVSQGFYSFLKPNPVGGQKALISIKAPRTFGVKVQKTF